MWITQSGTAHRLSPAGDINRTLADVSVSNSNRPARSFLSGEAAELGSGSRLVYVTAVIVPDDDGFYACAPGLRGLHIGGETLEAASKNVRDGVELYLRCMLRNDEPLELGEWISLEERPVLDQEQILLPFTWGGRVLSGTN